MNDTDAYHAQSETFESLSALFAASAQVDDARPAPAPPKPAPAKRRVPGKYDYTDKSIWTAAELDTATELARGALAAAAEHDPRERPEVTTRYAQSVRSEDIFLSLSGRLPASSHADTLVVEVAMPRTQEMAEIAVDVTRTAVDVRSSHYRLAMPLPNEVVETKGQARWDAERRVLELRLPIIKLFDV
ncbi:Protein pih1d3 [Blastocladiella emersonii ATCC 22665]|nr:Protein pih1d3 [Blastocladiella emersonii ATCC 22665]